MNCYISFDIAEYHFDLNNNKIKNRVLCCILNRDQAIEHISFSKQLTEVFSDCSQTALGFSTVGYSSCWFRIFIRFLPLHTVLFACHCSSVPPSPGPPANFTICWKILFVLPSPFLSANESRVAGYQFSCSKNVERKCLTFIFSSFTHSKLPYNCWGGHNSLMAI